jgi:histidinol-phosphate aminotransferase
MTETHCFPVRSEGDRPSSGRACLRDVSRYAADPTIARIDLSDNTNLWGMPPAASAALWRAGATTITRYPQPYSERLKEVLADYVGVSAELIATGCGSDDILDSAFRAFAEPGERIAFPDPTFTMVPTFARVNGLTPVAVPLTDPYGVDVDALLAADARIIYLCSPNNPTGGALCRDAIEAVIAGARSDQLVIVDEAYAEFAGTSVVGLIAQSDRLLVTRTLSKAFGLAGLRIGYAIGDPALITEVEKARGPYKVNSLAERAGLAAVTEGLPWVREHVALAIAARSRLTRELTERGLEPAESAANFVFLPLACGSAIARRMRSRGVAVRALENLTPVSEALRASKGSALRFTVGPWELVTEALSALDEARQSCG